MSIPPAFFFWHRGDGFVTLGSAAAHAQATLTGNLTADNACYALINTSDTTLGTQIGSGNSWPTTYSLTSTDLAPRTYYLQIEAIRRPV